MRPETDVGSSPIVGKRGVEGLRTPDINKSTAAECLQDLRVSVHGVGGEALATAIQHELLEV
jgi:hypothetical protein